MGVTSLIAVTSRPAAWRDRTAASRPTPGPFTKISTFLTPRAIASLAEASAAVWAANGVDFREPLKPTFPAEDHEIVFPCLSVMVIMVLLNVALIWATPSGSAFLSLFFVRFLGAATRHLLYLLVYDNTTLLFPFPASNRAFRPLTGSGIRLGTLAANRKTSAMPQASV